MNSVTNKTGLSISGVVLSAIFISSAAQGGTLTLSKTWNTTTPETLTAKDLNDNFAATKEAVDANAKDILDNGASITTNSSRLSQVKTVNSTAFKQLTTTNAENVLGISVTPPVDGFVMVQASSNMGVVMTSSGNIQLDASLATTSGTMDSANRTTLVWSTSTTEKLFVPFNIVGVFPVTANITSSFFLNAQIITGSTIANFYIGDVSDSVKLTALFVPLALP